MRHDLRPILILGLVVLCGMPSAAQSEEGGCVYGGHPDAMVCDAINHAIGEKPEFKGGLARDINILPVLQSPDLWFFAVIGTNQKADNQAAYGLATVHSPDHRVELINVTMFDPQDIFCAAGYGHKVIELQSLKLSEHAQGVGMVLGEDYDNTANIMSCRSGQIALVEDKKIRLLLGYMVGDLYVEKPQPNDPKVKYRYNRDQSFDFKILPTTANKFFDIELTHKRLKEPVEIPAGSEQETEQDINQETEPKAQDYQIIKEVYRYDGESYQLSE